MKSLNPFEVAHGDAAGVAEDVGDDEDIIALVEDCVSVGSRGAVGSFGEDAALEFCGVFVSDDAFFGGGDEDVAGLDEESLVREVFCIGESGEGFVGLEVF